MISLQLKKLRFNVVLVRFIKIGVSPSGKAPGFGPGISEVRILVPQPSIQTNISTLSFKDCLYAYANEIYDLLLFQ